MNLPIIRKVIKVGDSLGITLPRSWIAFFENETGTKITQVAIEVDRVLTVSPILPKKEVVLT
jgi:antitoxin component of MazEF toxin-antitoxin module